MKLKLTVENHHIRKVFGDFGAIELAARTGFDGIDFSFYKLEDDILTRTDYKEYAASLKAYAETQNIAFTQAHAPLTYSLHDKKGSLEEQFPLITRSMEIAALLGVPTIVVHTIKCPAGEDTDGINRRFYGERVPYAEKYGIKIGVENLFARTKDANGNEKFLGRLGTPAEMTAFVNTLDKRYFTVCLDVGHAALTGCEPQDFIRGMSADMLTSLHIQDNERIKDSHWLPYSGKLDWKEITSALKEIGYHGDFTLEILHYLDKYPAELLPEALRFAYAVGRRLADAVTGE